MRQSEGDTNPHRWESISPLQRAAVFDDVEVDDAVVAAVDVVVTDVAGAVPHMPTPANNTQR